MNPTHIEKIFHGVDCYRLFVWNDVQVYYESKTGTKILS